MTADEDRNGRRTCREQGETGLFVSEGAGVMEPRQDGVDQKANLGSPFFLILKIGLSVFACEAVIMLALVRLSPTSTLLTVLIDATALVLTLIPVLYFLVYRPLLGQVQVITETEAALHESHDRFLTLFQTCPDAITVTRIRDGRLTEVNDGFTLLSGYSHEDVLGKTTVDLPLWRSPEERGRLVSRLEQNGMVNNFEGQFYHKDGGIRTASISAKIITLGGEGHILSVARDVTDSKAAQLKQKTDYAFLLAVNAHRQKIPLIKAFVHEIQRVTGDSVIGIHTFEDGGSLTLQYCNGMKASFSRSNCRPSTGTAQCLCGFEAMEAFTSGWSLTPNPEDPIPIDITRRFLSSRQPRGGEAPCDIITAAGWESAALVPIQSQDKLLGLIHVMDSRKDVFTSQILDILKSASLHLASAMERINAEEALKRHRYELEEKVRIRTMDVMESNNQLLREIEERRRTEEELLAQRNKLRALSAELLETEARERRQIASELHDRIGQALALAKIKLGLLGESLTTPGTLDDVTEIRGFIEQAIADTRSLTFELSPPALYTLGLEAALAALIEQIGAQHAIKIELIKDDHPKMLDNCCRSIVYMAIRELILNVVKHAKAPNAWLTLRRAGDDLLAVVEDNGCGYDPSAVGGQNGWGNGFGLFSIEERLAPIGGRLAIESDIGRGTRAILTLPLDCGKRLSAGVK